MGSGLTTPRAQRRLLMLLISFFWALGIKRWAKKVKKRTKGCSKDERKQQMRIVTLCK